MPRLCYTRNMDGWRHARQRWHGLVIVSALVGTLTGCAPIAPPTPASPMMPPLPAPPLVTQRGLPAVAATAQTPVLPPVSPLPPAAAPAEVVLLPTPTPTPAAVALLPTPTPLPTPTLLPVTAADVAATHSVTNPGAVANPAVPFSDPAASQPASYVAQGNFTAQTQRGDAPPTLQQGNFVIVHAAAVNAYTHNRQITLVTSRADGLSDVINVYEVDDYIAINYATGSGDQRDWSLVRRDQGSSLVRAIQPILDLPLLLPRVLDQATLIGPVDLNGINALHYQMDDTSPLGPRLIQPLLSVAGDITDLQLDAWIAVPGGYVTRYTFQVTVQDAQVLDENGRAVAADQTVAWSYSLTPTSLPQPVVWPSAAPNPQQLTLVGFAPGAFPLPPDTSLLALVSGVPEWLLPGTPAQAADFYRLQLPPLGWEVTGANQLLRVTNATATLELLFTPDPAGGVRLTVLADN